MNINIIQAVPIWQNAKGYTEKSNTPVESKGVTGSSQIIEESNAVPISPEGISLGIEYLRNQLNTLLTSFPPFFPAGAPQRVDLIKKINTLEDQVGNSSMDADLKKMVTVSKLSDEASDQDISGALNNLFSLQEKINQQHPEAALPNKAGLLINLKI